MSSASGDLGVLRWIIDADDSALNAKLDNAEAKIRGMGARFSAALNGGSTPGAATFGGPVDGPNATYLPYAPALPSLTSTIPGNGFTGIGAPLFGGAGFGNTAIQYGGPGAQGFTAAAAYRNLFYNTVNAPGNAGGAPGAVPGGGGSPGGGSGASGFARPLIAAHLIYRVAEEAIQIEDQNRALDRVMARGSLEDQAQAGLSQVHGLNTGILGWIRRGGMTDTGDPILGSIGSAFKLRGMIKSGALASKKYNIGGMLNKGSALDELLSGGGDLDQMETDAENAVQSAKDQSASDRADRARKDIEFHSQFIGASPFLAMAEAPMAKYNGVVEQANALRKQAGLLSPFLTSSANLMQAAAGAELDKSMQYDIGHFAAARVLESGQRASSRLGAFPDRFNDAIDSIGKLTLEGKVAGVRATGDEFEASYTEKQGQFFLDESKEQSPLLRSLMNSQHASILGSMRAGHDREDNASIAAMRALLNNDPLSAQLAEDDLEPNVAKRNLKRNLHQKQWDDDSAQIDLNQKTQGDILRAHIAHPFGPSEALDAMRIGGDALAQALQFKDRPDQAVGALHNSLLSLTALSQDYFNGFRGRQINLANEDVSNPQNRQNPQDVAKAIDKAKEDILTALHELGSD